MKKITLILLSSLYLIFTACEDNEESLAEFGSISGTVNFTGTFPDSGEVLITLDKIYPPEGPPASFGYINSDNLTNNTYNYNFSDLSFRSYDAITVTYWTLGYSTAGSDNVLVGSHIQPIELTQDNPDVVIDIDAVFN
tara:strand:- start:17 stop:430 length:414 start_codon:yes stop_codon:yes gene_type:complete